MRIDITDQHGQTRITATDIHTTSNIVINGTHTQLLDAIDQLIRSDGTEVAVTCQYDAHDTCS